MVAWKRAKCCKLSNNPTRRTPSLWEDGMGLCIFWRPYRQYHERAAIEDEAGVAAVVAVCGLRQVGLEPLAALRTTSGWGGGWRRWTVRFKNDAPSIPLSPHSKPSGCRFEAGMTHCDAAERRREYVSVYPRGRGAQLGDQLPRGRLVHRRWVNVELSGQAQLQAGKENVWRFVSQNKRWV